MKKLKFGDLVLLSFPYSDQSTFKKRPALVICDLNDEDVILVGLLVVYTILNLMF